MRPQRQKSVPVSGPKRLPQRRPMVSWGMKRKSMSKIAASLGSGGPKEPYKIKYQTENPALDPRENAVIRIKGRTKSTFRHPSKNHLTPLKKKNLKKK